MSKNSIYNMYPGGTQIWWIADPGRYHRTDGPAYIRPDGTRFWYQYNLLHRENGPAVEWSNNTYEWWLRGKKYTYEEYTEKQKSLKNQD